MSEQPVRSKKKVASAETDQDTIADIQEALEFIADATAFLDASLARARFIYRLLWLVFFFQVVGFIFLWIV